MEMLSFFQRLSEKNKMLKYNISFLVSKSDFEINISKWRSDGNQILLLTGLVGAGKTTACEFFKNDYNAKCISFDALKFYEEANWESQSEIDEFVKIHPNIQPLIDTHWFETDNTNTNDKLYIEYCSLFFDYILKKYNNSEIPVVLEGIQIFVRIPIEKCLGMPCTIIRTSALKCCKRFMLRDYSKQEKINNLKCLAKLNTTYYFHQRKMLNEFIKDMNTC